MVPPETPPSTVYGRDPSPLKHMSHLQSISAPVWKSILRRPAFRAGLAFVVTILLFWPTLASFPRTWERYEYGHGWLIAALVVWLIWRDRHRLLAGSGWEPGWLIPLFGLSVVWLVAVVANLQVIHQAVFVLILVCWGLALFGTSTARMIIPLAVTFFVALPVWNGIVPLLRDLTTVASGGLVALLGVDAEITGNLVQLSAGTIIVADGCAGLNTFLAALAIGVVYANLFATGWRKQAAVVGLSVLIAIIGNWIRVALLIMVGHVTEMQSPLLDSHYWVGWLIFVVGLVPFLWAAHRLTQSRKKDPPDGVGPAPSAPSEAAASSGGRFGPPTGRTGVVTGIAVAGPLLYLAFGSLPAAGANVAALEDYVEEGGWTRSTSAGEQSLEWRPGYSGETDYNEAVFTDGTVRVHGYHFVYRDQSAGAEMIGYPNRIAPASRVVDDRLIGPVDREGKRWVHQAVIRTPGGAILVWYWYRVGGVEAALAPRAKLLEVLAFFRRRPAAELIAFSTACGPEDCVDAFETLTELFGGGGTAGSQVGSSTISP